jgi:hypothetical protein
VKEKRKERVLGLTEKIEKNLRKRRRSSSHGPNYIKIIKANHIK